MLDNTKESSEYLVDLTLISIRYYHLYLSIDYEWNKFFGASPVTTYEFVFSEKLKNLLIPLLITFLAISKLEEKEKKE